MILQSKKFQAALTGLVVVIVQPYVPMLAEVDIAALLAPLIAYIFGQSLADALPGKEKVIAEAAVKSLEAEISVENG